MGQHGEGFLVFVTADNKTTTQKVNGEHVTIGRDPSNGIHVPNQALSRVHVTITFRDEQFHILDHGSRNGTYVNGTRIHSNTATEVFEKDRIVLGVNVAVVKISRFTEVAVTVKDTPPAPAPAPHSAPPAFPTDIPRQQTQTNTMITGTFAKEVLQDGLDRASTTLVEAQRKAAQIIQQAQFEADAKLREVDKRASEQGRRLIEENDKRLREIVKFSEDTFNKAQMESQALVENARAKAHETTQLADAMALEIRKKAEQEREQILADARMMANQMASAKQHEIALLSKNRLKELEQEANEQVEQRLNKLQDSWEKEISSRRDSLDKELAEKRFATDREIATKLEEAAQSRQKEREQLDEEIKQKRSELDQELKKQLSEFKEQNSHLEFSIRDKKSELEKLNTEMEAQSKENDQLKSQGENQKTILSDLNQRLSQVKKELADALEAVTDNKDYIKTLANEKEDLEKRTAETRARFEKLKTETFELEVKANLARKLSDSLTEQTAAQENRLKSLDTEFEKMKSDLAKAQIEFKTAVSDKSNLENQIELLKTKSEELSKENSLLSSELQTKQHSLDQFLKRSEKEQSTITQELDELKNQLSASRILFEDIKQQLRTEQEEFVSVKSQNEAEQERAELLKKEISVGLSEKTEIEKLVAILQDKHIELNRSNEKLQNEIRSQTQELEHLQERSKRDQSEAHHELTQIREALQTAQAEYSRKTSEIQTVQKTLNQVSNDLEQTARRERDLAALAFDLDKKVQESASALRTHENKYELLQKDIRSSMNQLAQATTDLAEVNSKLAASEKNFETQLLQIKDKFEMDREKVRKEEDDRLEKIKLETYQKFLSFERDLVAELRVKQENFVRGIAIAVERLVKENPDGVDNKTLQGTIRAAFNMETNVAAATKSIDGKKINLLRLRTIERTRTAIISAIATAALISMVNYIKTNFSQNSLQQKIEQEARERALDLERRRFNPPQTEEYKESYMDNVVYTLGFSKNYVDPEFQKQLMKSLSSYMLKTWRIEEDKVIELLSTSTTLVKTLEEKKQAINPDFVNQALDKMRQTEKEAVARMTEVLGSEVRYESFQKFEKDFYHNHFTTLRTPANNRDE